MSARRIDCAQVRTGGHTGPPLRWKLPPRRAVHPKRSRLSFRNEKKLRFLLAYKLRKQRVTRLCIPMGGSLRPSLGIFCSHPWDLLLPPLGFFHPSVGILKSLPWDFFVPPWVGDFRSIRMGRQSRRLCNGRTTTRDPYRSLLVRLAALSGRLTLEPCYNIY